MPYRGRMSTSIHLLPANDLHPVLLGEDEYVGVPFAIPLLPGLAIAAELNLTEGRLFLEDVTVLNKDVTPTCPVWMR